MNFIIDFIAGSWQTILPILLAVGGLLFGSFQKNAANKARAKTELFKNVAVSERNRADTAENMTDGVIETAKKMQEDIDSEKNDTDDDRDHFL